MQNETIERGSIIWHDFGVSPQADGHEQQRRRPAVVVSNGTYNCAGLCVIAPVTGNTSSYMAFKVLIPKGICSAEGAIIADQLRTIDWRQRGYQPEDGRVVPEEIMDHVTALYESIINTEDSF